MSTLLLLAALMVPGDAPTAQPADTCATPAARAFDFWIGEWMIAQEILAADGSWLSFDATTTVTPALGGCALVERWSGTVQFFWENMDTPEPMDGLSVRAYDPETERWYIYWMDSRSPRFEGSYEGTFADGIGTFYRTWESPAGTQRGRIRFSSGAEGTVDWELAVSRDDGVSWTALWRMHMRRPRP